MENLELVVPYERVHTHNYIDLSTLHEWDINNSSTVLHLLEVCVSCVRVCVHYDLNEYLE